MDGLHNLPKHKKYRSTYQPFDYFWGLGVEHETYMQTSVYKQFESFENRMKPERYSVSYYKAYEQVALKKALKRVVPVLAPMLLNAYAMVNTDVFGEHSTRYVRGSPPNPAFCGKTLFEWMCEHSTWLADNYDKSFVWDGDTVEFITQDFYKTTVERVIQELAILEDRFTKELAKMPAHGIIKELGPIRLVENNEPWATYTTNRDNLAMFNNGTIHINVTLPTRLNHACKPLWFADFVNKHRRLARLIQWIEPLWISLYGSPDPFTRYPDLQPSFAAGSQRLAVSRYIGMGTFDTNLMPTGKILQIQKPKLPWYEALHAKTAYEPLEVIGLDLNFNKHWAHGLEIRIFDQIPMLEIREVLLQTVGLMDLSLSLKEVADPRESTIWHTMATVALYEGRNMIFDQKMLKGLFEGLSLDFPKDTALSPQATMDRLMKELEQVHGYCWSHIVEGNKSTTCLF